MGLKPLIKLVCPHPNCDFQFRYHARDPQMHPDTWVMTAESRAHLAGPAPIVVAVDNIIPINQRRSQPRFRKSIRPVRKAA